MRNENYKEGFISKDIELRKITEWPQTEVFSLENLPKRITDRFPDGFVLKHVSDPLWEARETMGGDVLWASRCQSALKNLSERDKHELSVEELAAYIKSGEYKCTPEWIGAKKDEPLRERISYLLHFPVLEAVRDFYMNREDELVDFFADTLPHLVLKGDYIIGKKDADSPRDIYSIHPKITDYFDLSSGLFQGPSLSHGFEAKRSQELQATSNEIRKLYTKEQIAHICEQLEMFLVKLKQYIDQHNGIFDFIVGDNFVISKDGDLKLIDTNVIIPIANSQDQERYNRIEDDEFRSRSIGEEKPFDRDESEWESRVFREVETANEIPKIFLALEKLIASLRRPRTN